MPPKPEGNGMGRFKRLSALAWWSQRGPFVHRGRSQAEVPRSGEPRSSRSLESGFQIRSRPGPSHTHSCSVPRCTRYRVFDVVPFKNRECSIHALLVASILVHELRNAVYGPETSKRGNYLFSRASAEVEYDNRCSESVDVWPRQDNPGHT
jgi:hypothetical protein